MAKKKKQTFYGLYGADRRRDSRVCETWDEASEYMTAVRNCAGKTLRYKKFHVRADAEFFARYGRAPSFIAERIPGRIVVYTDGSSRAGVTAGCGVFFDVGSPFNLAEPFTIGKRSNNRAELWAIKRAIDIVESSSASFDCAADVLVIHTDSSYSINALTVWRNEWQTTNFRDGTIANRDIIEQVWATIDNCSYSVEFEWVSGHAGIIGNEHADVLAKEGADKTTTRIPSPTAATATTTTTT